MKQRLFLHLILFLGFLAILSGVFYMLPHQTEKEIGVEPGQIKKDSLKLLFTGDIMVHDIQIQSAYYEGGDTTWNFYPSFIYVQEYLASGDVTFGNLEVTFGGTPYRGYPLFSAPPQLAGALKAAGYDFLFTANNHALDRYGKGLEGTIMQLENMDLKHTGIFRDSLERENNYPYLLEVNNIRLALLNYTYSTNGMEVTNPHIVNYMDTFVIRKDLQRARELNPDYIITSMHWGEEYKSVENREQQELAQFLADNGTDLIIGCHPHVVQPFRTVVSVTGDTVPEIYSLGNFISNQQWRYSDGGIIVEVILSKQEEKVCLESISYEPVWVYRYPEEWTNVFRLIPVNDYKKSPEKYSLTVEALETMEEFYEDTRRTLNNLSFSGFFNQKNF